METDEVQSVSRHPEASHSVGYPSAGQSEVRWPAQQQALIMQIEVSATQASVPTILAHLVGIKTATKSSKEYPVVHRHVPSRVDNQPYLDAVFHGGAMPGRGPVLVDTGAAFSMMSERVVEAHGLKMKPHSGTFRSASSQGPLGDIVGAVDVDL